MTIVETILKARGRELALIDTALRPGSDYPEHWQRDLTRYRDTLLTNLRRTEFFLPVELSGRSVRNGYAKIRKFIRMSSACLTVWPTLWAEARERARVA